MRIGRKPPGKNNASRLESAVQETEESDRVNGCCTITKGGNQIVYKNVSQHRCDGLAKDMAGIASWKPGPCK